MWTMFVFSYKCEIPFVTSASLQGSKKVILALVLFSVLYSYLAGVLRFVKSFLCSTTYDFAMDSGYLYAVPLIPRVLSLQFYMLQLLLLEHQYHQREFIRIYSRKARGRTGTSRNVRFSRQKPVSQKSNVKCHGADFFLVKKKRWKGPGNPSSVLTCTLVEHLAHLVLRCQRDGKSQSSQHLTLCGALTAKANIACLYKKLRLIY